MLAGWVWVVGGEGYYDCNLMTALAMTLKIIPPWQYIVRLN
jgi:hypothetical protein